MKDGDLRAELKRLYYAPDERAVSEVVGILTRAAKSREAYVTISGKDRMRAAQAIAASEGLDYEYVPDSRDGDYVKISGWA